MELDLDGDKQPDGWKVKQVSGDKLKCNQPDKLIAHAGNCAYLFKGFIGENTKLEQTLDEVNFALNDTLTLALFYNTKNSGEVKFTLKSAAGQVIVKEKLVLNATTDYEMGSKRITVQTSDISKIKIQIRYKGSAGKLLIDDVSLLQGQDNLLVSTLK
jgi:hypothetical protein